MTSTRETYVELARAIRKGALNMVHKARSSHIGGGLSIADILAVLYGSVLRVDPARPDWSERDRFILSKGHAAAAMYAVLAERGFFPKEWCDTYCQDGSRLTGHVSHHVPGIEVSTGSLGHGLPLGCGMALAAKADGKDYRVFVLMSDGEMDEGSNWESILFAPHHRLDNLVAIIDCNGLQGFGRTRDVLNIEPLADKWRACNWAVRQIDGHDYATIEMTLAGVPFEPGRPSVVIAKTVKGKGVSFMEDQIAWHYRSPNPEELKRALDEVEGRV